MKSLKIFLKELQDRGGNELVDKVAARIGELEKHYQDQLVAGTGFGETTGSNGLEREEFLTMLYKKVEQVREQWSKKGRLDWVEFQHIAKEADFDLFCGLLLTGIQLVVIEQVQREFSPNS